MWAMKEVTVIPVFVGSLGAITITFGNFVEDIGI